MANYGGVYRGTKVKNAQDNGMIGCIIFTDPLDDGEVTEENGYEAYPSPPCPSYKARYVLNMFTRWTSKKSLFDSARQRPLLFSVLRRPINCWLGLRS